jgi:hypothetical protein
VDGDAKTRAIGAPTQLHFLAQEGPTRADTIVRQENSGHGVGLEFTAVKDGDRPHLALIEPAEPFVLGLQL